MHSLCGLFNDEMFIVIMSNVLSKPPSIIFYSEPKHPCILTFTKIQSFSTFSTILNFGNLIVDSKSVTLETLEYNFS